MHDNESLSHAMLHFQDIFQALIVVYSWVLKFPTSLGMRTFAVIFLDNSLPICLAASFIIAAGCFEPLVQKTNSNLCDLGPCFHLPSSPGNRPHLYNILLNTLWCKTIYPSTPVSFKIHPRNPMQKKPATFSCSQKHQGEQCQWRSISRKIEKNLALSYAWYISRIVSLRDFYGLESSERSKSDFGFPPKELWRIAVHGLLPPLKKCALRSNMRLSIVNGLYLI
jgi:hypothetical protein